MKELSLQELAEIGKEIRSRLMLRTMPLAIQFIKKPEDFPSKIRFPHKDLGCKVAFCQAMHIVRTFGITIGITREDYNWMPCQSWYGLGGEVEDEDVAEHWVKEMGMFKDVETTMKFLKSLPRFAKGENFGIAISPLEWTRVKPDVVVIYCVPGQLQKLVLAANFARGSGISGHFTGVGGVCFSAILPALRTREPRVFLPGGGDRGIALTSDEEVGMVIPPERLEEIVEGLKGGKVGALKYPVAPYLLYTAVTPYESLKPKVKW